MDGVGTGGNILTFFGVGSTFVDISAIIIVTFIGVTNGVSIAVTVTICTFVIVNTTKSVSSETCIAGALVGTWNVGSSGPFVTAVQVIGSTFVIIGAVPL